VLETVIGETPAAAATNCIVTGPGFSRDFDIDQIILFKFGRLKKVHCRDTRQIRKSNP
jgi:hypothetical protein